ncbi:adenylate/guanylate cyclase domain-containing protein [Leptospira idonii]|uniref:Adenylate/guanylate cyclase domain-containing protein n=2 Tax=Leptospira idonii TaxID=1193500 RepID=A0A4R9M6E8_9LEPT|nr:adenylate/guanylate cyclase domain-containing protein [Leptospira idonii]
MILETANSFEQSFSREILRSEVRRASAIVIIFLSGFFAFLLQPYFFPVFHGYIAASGFPIWAPPCYFLFNMVYGLCLRQYYIWSIRKDRKLNRWIRYGTAFYESTIPTLVFLFLGHFYNYSLEALNSPPGSVYFLFIILATLRLEERMAIFSGSVSAIQFLCLFFYFQTFNFNVSSISVLENQAFFYAKSAILFASGFVAAFVTRQIKTAIKNSFQHELDKNQIRSLFGQHVSPVVVNQLLAQKEDWEGELRHVCMLFFDIRNFTQFSESQSPAQLIQFLNTVFSHSIECVNRNGGIINKFLGDGFMAVFGAPVSTGKDVENAVKASAEIRATIHKLIEEGTLPKIGIGIGLHCGEAVTGNVGSVERKEYTIIGDVVNLAARIEQLNKTFGSEILASEEVFQMAGDAKQRFSSLGETTVKGKSLPVKIYQMV